MSLINRRLLVIPIALISSVFFVQCNPGDTKSGTQDSTSVATEDLPFDTLISFCNWSELSLRATPSEKGKYVTTVYLGEHLHLTGDTASEVVKGKRILYRKASLLDGKEGWLSDQFLAVDAVPGVVINQTSVFQRPDAAAVSSKTFAVLDLVAVKPSTGNFVEVNGKPADKTWFQNGYLRLADISLTKRDVELAVLYRRAMEAKDDVAQQSLLDHIVGDSYLQASPLFKVIFPEVYQPEEGDTDGGEGSAEPYYIAADFNGRIPDLYNNGATFTADRNGTPNSALFFNGNAWLSRPADDTNEASYCFWVQLTKVQQEGVVLIVGNACTSGYALNLNDDNNGGMKVTVLCGGVQTNITDSDYSLILNEWTHLCLVKSGNKFSIYVNGALSTSGESGYNPPTEGLTVGGAWGCNPTEQKGTFYGNMDDLYMTNKALDEAGVKEVQNGTFR